MFKILTSDGACLGMKVVLTLRIMLLVGVLL